MFSEDLRRKIREAFEEDQNYRAVGRKFNISHQTVKYIVENDYGKEKDKRGPKFKLDRHQELAIRRETRRLNEEQEKVTASKIQSNLSLNCLSLVSLRRNMRRLGFTHKLAKQKIVLTKEHKKRRLDIAKMWLKNRHDWYATIFSDEKKFNLDGPDNWSTYADPDREIHRNRRQMGGGSVMVWGMVLPNGYVHVERLHGRIDGQKYIDMLNTSIDNLNAIFGPRMYYFQQDNASIHTSKVAKEFFDKKNCQLIPWPARSPDLNIMENVWHMLSLMVYDKKQYQTQDELWEAIKTAADRISSEKVAQVQNLYSDVTQRLIEVIEKKGDKIDR